MIPLIEKFCIYAFYFRVSSISLWQVVFLVSCGFALWNIARLSRSLPARDLIGLAAVFLIGAALRLSISPRNIVDTNYRGLASWHMVQDSQAFQKEYTLDRVRTSHQYYTGYGHAEYLRLFSWGSARSDIENLWRISGITAMMNVLLLSLAAWLMFGDPKIAFWSAALLALSPADIRLAFGDSRYALGGTLILLGLIHFLAFFQGGGWTALLPALGFTYCLVYTHVVFLLFPLAVPFFYPLCLPRRRDCGAPLTKTHAVLVALAALFMLPAYVVGPLPYSLVARDQGIWQHPFSYLWRVLHLLSHKDNAFLNPDVTPPLFMGCCLLGCGALWIRARGALTGLGAAVLLLTAPLAPDYSANSALVKQQPAMCFYLLAAAFGVHACVEFLGRRLSRRLAAAAAVILLALQPVGYAEFIGKGFNYQKELSFLKDGCPRLEPDLGGHVFTLAPAMARIRDVCPGEYEVHTISQSVSGPDVEQSPTDHRPTFRLLDCLLSRDRPPLFYLSYACYYRHPMDISPRSASGLRDDCARFMQRYRLEPLVEETFPSSVYDRESDNTDARRITLGFYRVHQAPAARKRSGVCPGGGATPID